MAKTKKDDGAKEPTTDAIKRLTVNLPLSVHRAFKTRCTEQGLEMTEVVVGLIDNYLSNSEIQS